MKNSCKSFPRQFEFFLMRNLQDIEDYAKKVEDFLNTKNEDFCIIKMKPVSVFLLRRTRLNMKRGKRNDVFKTSTRQ